eukprot:1672647-Alexandrium_andersonii.AAC.1
MALKGRPSVNASSANASLAPTPPNAHGLHQLACPGSISDSQCGHMNCGQMIRRIAPRRWRCNCVVHCTSGPVE